MLIAHLPSGYLLARSLKSRHQTVLGWPLTLSMGLMGSLFPDLDMIYFYFIDNQQHLHHAYPTHIPFYWLVAYSALLAVGWILKSRRITSMATVFFAGVMLHLVLDTLVGGIKWGYPVSPVYMTFVTVPAVYPWWVLNFILHWTFFIEVLILFGAVSVYVGSNRQ